MPAIRNDTSQDAFVSARRVADALRSGIIPKDATFDRFLPDELRVVSGQHWTPLVVAKRVAGWFDELHVRSVVDIGSGAGKFCVAAALCGNSHYYGIEQRPRLVDAARGLASAFHVDDRVEFAVGTLGEIAAPIADAYYLYNPFGENLFGAIAQLDNDVELSDMRYDSGVAAVEELLERVPLGTCVVTFNGFGGRFPPRFHQVRVDREMPSMLRLLQKLDYDRGSPSPPAIER